MKKALTKRIVVPVVPVVVTHTSPLSLRAAELVEITRVPRLIQQDVMYLVDNHNEKTQIVVREPLDGRRLLAAGGRESR